MTDKEIIFELRKSRKKFMSKCEKLKQELKTEKKCNALGKDIIEKLCKRYNHKGLI